MMLRLLKMTFAMSNQAERAGEVARGHVLGRLPREDLDLIVELVLQSGSLKGLAKSYSVSYPTIRNRVDKVIGRLRDAVDGREPDLFRELLATLVERGAREFISRLMPCRIEIEAEVESSRHENCVRGVKLLRAEDYEGAASNFKLALQDNPDDSRAAFGAGIACEASGQYKDALKYYKQACMGAEDATYRDARDRMKTYGDRIRG